MQEKKYTCYLSEDTYLPMMYMEDAIRATINLMQVDSKKIKIRSSYNLAGISFSPKEVFEEIKKHMKEKYKIGFFNRVICKLRRLVSQFVLLGN